MGVFSGFDERVLPLCDFSKMESSIGEWESSERVLALWASSHNSSERAEYANASLLRFCRMSIATGRVLKTGEQHRRMGVFRKSIGIMGEFSKLFRESRRGEWEFSQVLTKEYWPLCDFTKLESSIGEWESSERVLALWASSQNSSERAD